MATKDRTSLKNDFANGKYATGEKFADLIDSMKVVQLPVVDPQALGTSLSFIDSISQDEDGKITATKKTLDLANAHELNPFKGWYKTGDTLPTDGFDGAYLYFKDTSELTGQTTIYRWNGTTYADTGTVVDTSNVQTFETGQAVNGTGIKDLNGNNDPNASGVFSAEAGKELGEEIYGETTETVEEIVLTSANTDHYYNTNLYSVGDSYPINSSPSSSSGNAARRITNLAAGAIYRYKGSCNSNYYKIFVVKPVEGSTNGIITREFKANYRTNALDIIVADEEVGGTIYFNFYGYNSSTDGLWMVERTTSGGLEARVQALEDNPASDTFTTEEKVSDISLRNELTNSETDLPTTKCLSGVINGTSITVEEDVTPLRQGKYYNTTNATVGSVWNFGMSSIATSCCIAIEVSAGDTYKIYGEGGAAAVRQYVLLDSQKVVLSKAAYAVDSRDAGTTVNVAQNGYLVVNFVNYISTDKLTKLVAVVSGGIQPQIDSLDGRLTALESDGKPFTGKTFLVFGDSLSQLDSTVTGENSKRWSDYFSEITGATIVNVAIGGARLAQNRVKSSIITDPNAEGYTNSMNIMSALCVLNMVRAVCGLEFNSSYTYMQLAQQFAQSATSASGAVGAVARLASVDITTIDGVIILAGGNDYQAGGNIEGAGENSVQKAIELIVEALLTANPKLSIYWGTPLVCYATDDAGSGGVYNDAYWSDVYVAAGGKTGEQVADFIFDKVRLQKIPVVDMYHEMGWTKANFNQWFYDHIHPRKGLKQIARKLAAFVIANRNFD